MKIKVNEKLNERAEEPSTIEIVFPGVSDKSVVIILSDSLVEVKYSQLEKYDSGSVQAMAEALDFAAYISRFYREERRPLQASIINYFNHKKGSFQVIEYFCNEIDVLKEFHDLTGNKMAA